MRKKVKLLCILNFLAIVFCVSCSLKEIKTEAPGINKIELGNKYRINLPENHSDGFIWQLNEKYDKTIIDNINTVWHGNEKGVDFNFNTLADGQTTLTFVLRKYNDTSQIKHFIVEIRGK